MNIKTNAAVIRFLKRLGACDEGVDYFKSLTKKYSTPKECYEVALRSRSQTVRGFIDWFLIEVGCAGVGTGRCYCRICDGRLRRPSWVQFTK